MAEFANCVEDEATLDCFHTNKSADSFSYTRNTVALIGSLQIAVPAGCMNNCRYCVYRQHVTKFKTCWRTDHKRWVLEVERRLRYAADRVSSVMITSQGEPTLNMDFIRDVVEILNRVTPELAQIELQTSGVGLTEERLEILYRLGVRVISLSIPALEKENNLKMMRVPKRYDYDPLRLCEMIREKGFVLRLSIPVTRWFDDYTLDEILQLLKNVWIPDQISFKRIYGASDFASKRYDEFVGEFKQKYKNFRLELLTTGLWKYDVLGMGIVWNDNCMVSEVQEEPRYLILQPDGRLYTRWDKRGSIVF